MGLTESSQSRGGVGGGGGMFGSGPSKSRSAPTMLPLEAHGFEGRPRQATTLPAMVTQRSPASEEGGRRGGTGRERARSSSRGRRELSLQRDGFSAGSGGGARRELVQSPHAPAPPTAGAAISRSPSLRPLAPRHASSADRRKRKSDPSVDARLLTGGGALHFHSPDGGGGGGGAGDSGGSCGCGAWDPYRRAPDSRQYLNTHHRVTPTEYPRSTFSSPTPSSGEWHRDCEVCRAAPRPQQASRQRPAAIYIDDDHLANLARAVDPSRSGRERESRDRRRVLLRGENSSASPSGKNNNNMKKVDLVRRVPAGGGEGGGGGGVQHVSSVTLVPVNAAAKGATRGGGVGAARGTAANAALRRPRPYPIPVQDRGCFDDGERGTRRRKKKPGPRNKVPRKGLRAENTPQEFLPGAAEAIRRRPFLPNQNNARLLLQQQQQQDQGLDTEGHLFYRGEKALSGEVAWPLEGDPYICLHYGSTVARRRRPRPSLLREVRTWQKDGVGGDGDDGGATEEKCPTATLTTSWDATGTTTPASPSPPPPAPPPRPKSQRAQVVIQLGNVVKGPEDLLDEWNGNTPGGGGVPVGGEGGGAVPMGYNVWFESAGLAARPLSEIQMRPRGGGGGDNDVTSGVVLDNRPDAATVDRRISYGAVVAPKRPSPSSSPSPSPTPTPSPSSSLSPPAPSPPQESPSGQRPPPDEEEQRVRHATERSIVELPKMELECPLECLVSMDPRQAELEQKEDNDNHHHHQGLAINEDHSIYSSLREKDLTVPKVLHHLELGSPRPDLPAGGGRGGGGTCTHGQEEQKKCLLVGVPWTTSPPPTLKEDVGLSKAYNQSLKEPLKGEISGNCPGGLVAGEDGGGGGGNATSVMDLPQQTNLLLEVNGNLNEAEDHREVSQEEPSGVAVMSCGTLRQGASSSSSGSSQNPGHGVHPGLGMTKMRLQETNISEGMETHRNDGGRVPESGITTRDRDDILALLERTESWMKPPSVAARNADRGDVDLGPWENSGRGPGRRPKSVAWSSTLPQSDSRLPASSVWGDRGRRRAGRQDRSRSLDIFPVLRLPLGNQPRLVDVLKAAQAKEEAAATAGEKYPCEVIPMDTPSAGSLKVEEGEKGGEVPPPGPTLEGGSTEGEPCPHWWGLEGKAEEFLGQLPTAMSPMVSGTVKAARRHTVALDLGRGSPFATPPEGRFGATLGGTCPSAGLQKSRAYLRQGPSTSSGKWNSLPEHRAPRLQVERRKGELSAPSVSSSTATPSVNGRVRGGTPHTVPSQDCDFTCHEQCQDLVTLDCKTLSQGGGVASSSSSSSLDHLEDPFSVESPSTPTSPVGRKDHPLGEEGVEGEEEEEGEKEEKVEDKEDEEEEGQLQEEQEEDRPDGTEEDQKVSEASTPEATAAGGTAEDDGDDNDNDADDDGDDQTLRTSTLRVKEAKKEGDDQEKDQFEGGTLRVTPRPTMTREVSTLRKSATRLQSHLVGSDQLEEWVAKYNASSQGLQITKEQDGSFRGCIRVHLNLSRPINIVAGTRPPSIYDILQEDRTVEKTLTSFYMPRDAVKAIHVTSKTTTGEVIVALLRKFKVVDNPQKFALYERTYDTAQSAKAKLRRLGDQECPLVLALNWSAQGLSNKRLVLQENDTADIQWEAFTLPELSNFLRILDREEEEYRCQICDKYDLLRKRIQDQLLHIKPQR
ncbi:uncharacterized protein LOC143018875 [Oratosquilla oratoria]|uniref:uncharacterized protein LOC143018875 n=1 Tax=Oratosquilla oratoria TaxID=337810 RepID=UPI003F757EA7